MSMRESLYQIVVADYSRKRNGRRQTVVLPDGKGGHSNKIDVEPDVHKRTLLKRFGGNKAHKRAMAWGRKFGTVLSCRKVDHEAYLKNIEHLNLTPKPIVVEMDSGEFTINRDLQMQRTRRRRGRKIDIEILDKND